MMKCKKSLISKALALGLSFILFYGDFGLYSRGVTVVSGELRNTFEAALADYRSNAYEEAAAKLESLLNLNETVEPFFKAKVCLLLGACYERTGKKDKAKGYFLELKKLADGGFIEAVPAIPAVDPDSLSAYREIFGTGPFFRFKEPVPVSKVLKRKVRHGPRKSIEQKEKEKKEKKFPWLIAIGAVVIFGTAAVLLLAKESNRIRKEEEEEEEEESDLPKISWRQVQAGEFLMGDNFNEGEGDELPVHMVYLDEFYISAKEISQKNYEFFCKATGRALPWDIYEPRYPVTEITWHDAKAFCDWLSEKTGDNIHLPTEAQWEKAARGTDQRRYPWGNAPPDNMKANFSRGITGSVIFVDFRTGDGISPFLLYNMAGNAAEWCADWYSASYYPVSPVNNPTGPASGPFRVVRGGSYKDDAQGIRSANRDFNDPAGKAPWIGFRIVKEVD